MVLPGFVGVKDADVEDAIEVKDNVIGSDCGLTGDFHCNFCTA